MRFRLDTKRCMCCKRCYLACAVQRNGFRSLPALLLEGGRPTPLLQVVDVSGISSILSCIDCEKMSCLFGCIGGARWEGSPGKVRMDPRRCTACNICILLCPHSGNFIGPEGEVLKCEGCPEYDEPPCLASCPTGALAIEGAGGGS